MISRGVRPLSLIGTIVNDPYEVDRTYDKMCFIASGTGGTQDVIPIPIAILCTINNRVHIGFAAYEWVVEIYRWLLNGELPQKNLNRIRGLLLGYSASAIASFEKFQSGQLFLNTEGDQNMLPRLLILIRYVLTRSKSK